MDVYDERSSSQAEMGNMTLASVSVLVSNANDLDTKTALTETARNSNSHNSVGDSASP
eukprot:SAG11_NODE_1256_length_5374_cov_5.627627_8_plen_58_part_00